jgi:hypothetical protein
VTKEIIGYHLVGPEDDYLKPAEGGPSLWLHHLVSAAGGKSVDWGVFVAHERIREGHELGPFADDAQTPLPPLKRYRLTLEIFDVEGE